MRVIPIYVHAIIDYLMGILMIVSPWVFGFAAEGAETWVPVIIGAGMIVAALMTHAELGAAALIPVPMHLAIDAVAGIFLVVSPWLFGFAGLVWIPHVVLGLLEFGGAAMTRTGPSLPDGVSPRSSA